ncbi:M18 family aminopeptidase [Gynuella sunshinyii]|uniref:M18 family aminopeptidase n=1 Tax=Gynuella sunshinyii YC6258 TaxID=1445510 RepID=A0A0C5VNZ6_9GAMM|nr:M18 family aminopeptidase [Gynuella sunshinyii]AJQ96392.1 aspartyl aminopeptidase [Gynuella sunshinyii YC6258]
MSDLLVIQELLDFLGKSPTPFHAVQQVTEQLLKAGYVRLDEKQSWQLAPEGKYFTTRNDSSLIAFHTGRHDPTEAGIRMMGAHTDSPALKVKPSPVTINKGYLQLAVEVYGGVLLNPWFDRDLSLAGRVSYKTNDGILKNALIDFRTPIAIIPSLAIHLDRTQNESKKINPQTDLPPILAQVSNSENFSFESLLKDQINDDALAEVLDWELFFYDTQLPAEVGLNKEFIASARLDNLLSCFIGLQSFINSDASQPALIVFNDHEEVGSASASGADGPFLKQVLERWIGDSAETFVQTISRSLMISVDNAHGVHPNFASWHEPDHQPILNSGPVIKINANQRYASNSTSQALFRHICQQVNVPVQVFVVRSDLACGSTIGPITATNLGVNTVDVGVATFAMHSIRETAGAKDPLLLLKALQHFFNSSSISA